MQAGVWRATSPTIPPSAAWGLVLNLAGIETRSPEPSRTTLIRADAPSLRIAIGAVRPSSTASLLQQLHTYPVGASGKEFKERTYGAKYWIAPVRREILVDLNVVLGVQAMDDALLDRVEGGSAGNLDVPRYGLPFAGDNSLIFDRIDSLATPPPARWYCPMVSDGKPRRGSCRLTIGIDRADAARTTSLLFAPEEDPTTEPPHDAWIWVPNRPG
jgi:CRISPR-associated protein Cas5t